MQQRLCLRMDLEPISPIRHCKSCEKYKCRYSQKKKIMDIQSYSLNLDVMFKLVPPQPP